MPEYKYVRTDSRVTTLDTFVYRPKEAEPMEVDQQAETRQTQIVKKPRVDVRLTSVLQLRKEVKKEENAGLTSIFSYHSFIGCVDDVLALIQYEQNIYLVNYNVARYNKKQFKLL